MQTRIEVEQANMKANQLELFAKSESSLDELSPSGKMLVDSDHLSFIYMLEHKGSYVYLSVNDEYWNMLKQAINDEKEIVLLVEDQAITLDQAQDEINYLIENIKGNLNYGDEMVKKVEQVFGS